MTRSLIHIIDDDPSVRSALQGLLRSVSLSSVSYTRCAEFLNVAKPDIPSCLLLDVRLPEVSGIEFQSQLVPLGIHMPVIMITGYGDIPMSVRAMKAGAIDFLPKPFRDQDLLEAIHAALERDMQRRQEAERVSELEHCYQCLTERERQVMELVTLGYMNKQAASELGISEITIKLHRASMMRKMQARTLADLVKMAEKLSRKQMHYI